MHARSWWDSFTSPVAAEVSNSKGRFVEAGSNHRWVWWQEAWRGFRAHPVAGTGAGSFTFTNLRYRTSSLDTATEPHDLPLQFLSETGLVGAVLFAAAALTLVIARPPASGRRARARARAAGLPRCTACSTSTGTSLRSPRPCSSSPARSSRVRRRARARSARSPALLARGGVALAVLVSLFAVWLGDRWSGQAATRSATPRHAIALAKRARSLDPLAVEPLFTQALAEQALGDPARARALSAKATRVQPENAEAWYALGAFDLGSAARAPR